MFKHKQAMLLALTLFTLLLFTTGIALAESYGWRDHRAPFDFRFGNHIDTHQQTKTGGQSQLQGFFYIRFTGETTDDGIAKAKHADCGLTPAECTVGWMLHGVPVRATLVKNESGAHPVWCIDPAEMPKQKGYTHFHWLGQPDHAGGLTLGAVYEGYVLKLTARETFFFEHHGGFLVTPGIDYATHANIVTDCAQ